MKKINAICGSLLLMVLLFSTPTFSQITPDTPITIVMENPDVAQEKKVTFENVEELAEQIIYALTGSETEIDLPAAPKANDWSSVMTFYILMLGSFGSLLTYVFTLFFPGVSKKDLIVKATCIGITVIVVFISWKGVSVTSILVGLASFLMQAFTYKYPMNFLGLKSWKSDAYYAEKKLTKAAA